MVSGPPYRQLVEFDQDQFETILRNTAQLLSESHPDVLALRTRSIAFPPPADVEVSTPPIFLLSWERLLSASQTGYFNILPDRLWRRVRGRTNPAPHFSWGRAESVFAAQSRATERQFFNSLTAAVGRATSATKDTPTATGKVKWFDDAKGIGVIAPDGGSNDVFVRIAAVKRLGLISLEDNQRVAFDIKAGRDGRESAINLSLEGSNAAPQSLDQQPLDMGYLELPATTRTAKATPKSPSRGSVVTRTGSDQATESNARGKPSLKNLASFAPRFELARMLAAATTPEEAVTQVARQFGLPPAATAKWLDKEVFDRLRAQVEK
ncbi:MAG: cold-shock protein [Gammaproteobacteria bacterium]|nr:cold-shock protein [Gammaproteobacteria bacterium]